MRLFDKDFRKKLKNAKGFTLMELLIVLGIMVIIATIAIPATRSFLRRMELQKLDNAARDIYMAAQNRTGLLNSAGKLDDFLEKNRIGAYSNVTWSKSGSEWSMSKKDGGDGKMLGITGKNWIGIPDSPYVLGAGNGVVLANGGWGYTKFTDVNKVPREDGTSGYAEYAGYSIVKVSALDVAGVSAEGNLLPNESILASYWGKYEVYVVYADSCVTDVFVFQAGKKAPTYSGGAFGTGDGDTWAPRNGDHGALKYNNNFYNYVDYNDRIKNKILVGWYGPDGVSALPLMPPSVRKIPAPIIEIQNDEELRVVITHWQPKTTGLSLLVEIPGYGKVELIRDAIAPAKNINKVPNSGLTGVSTSWPYVVGKVTNSSGVSVSIEGSTDTEPAADGWTIQWTLTLDAVGKFESAFPSALIGNDAYKAEMKVHSWDPQQAGFLIKAKVAAKPAQIGLNESEWSYADSNALFAKDIPYVDPDGPTVTAEAFAAREDKLVEGSFMKYDASGEPVLGSEGKFEKSVSLGSGAQYSYTVPEYKTEKKDGDGNIVKDGDGNPVMETVPATTKTGTTTMGLPHIQGYHKEYTAYVANVRHLQNVSRIRPSSLVKHIVQTADIDCHGDVQKAFGTDGTGAVTTGKHPDGTDCMIYQNVGNAYYKPGDPASYQFLPIMPFGGIDDNSLTDAQPLGVLSYDGGWHVIKNVAIGTKTLYRSAAGGTVDYGDREGSGSASTQWIYSPGDAGLFQSVTPRISNPTEGSVSRFLDLDEYGKPRKMSLRNIRVEDATIYGMEAHTSNVGSLAGLVDATVLTKVPAIGNKDERAAIYANTVQCLIEVTNCEVKDAETGILVHPDSMKCHVKNAEGKWTAGTWTNIAPVSHAPALGGEAGSMPEAYQPDPDDTTIGEGGVQLRWDGEKWVPVGGTSSDTKDVPQWVRPDPNQAEEPAVTPEPAQKPTQAPAEIPKQDEKPAETPRPAQKPEATVPPKQEEPKQDDGSGREIPGSGAEQSKQPAQPQGGTVGGDDSWYSSGGREIPD